MEANTLVGKLLEKRSNRATWLLPWQAPGYPFTKSGIPYLSIHYQYNSLVMNINGKTGTQILEWVNDKYGKEIYGYEQSVSRVLVKGRKRLEDVCNLVFP